MAFVIDRVPTVAFSCVGLAGQILLECGDTYARLACGDFGERWFVISAALTNIYNSPGGLSSSDFEYWPPLLQVLFTIVGISSAPPDSSSHHSQISYWLETVDFLMKLALP
jgi:hypothetical protein